MVPKILAHVTEGGGGDLTTMAEPKFSDPRSLERLTPCRLCAGKQDQTGPDFLCGSFRFAIKNRAVLGRS